jgi:signal transduction histidine kinase
VRADPDQLKQVILNLALNALQATPYESVVTLATTGASRQGVKCARIEITDEGPGIPSDQLEHVFVPFFTTKEKGTGLGLAIAQQIVREHGGLISVQNVSHRGARFAIDLPCVEADSLLGGEIRAYNS